MRLGLVLVSGSVRGDVELISRAERNGFHSAFTIEFFNRNGFVPLAASAPQTRSIQLGTGIANSFTRAPLLLASAAMDIDELSGGRMILGLGSATRRMNEDWYGVAFSKPAARTRELVQLLRAAFAAQKGGGFRWDGEFWKLNVPVYARPNAARASVPIWIAAVNRGVAKTCGAVADALIGHPIATRRWHREVTLACIAEGEREAGRAAGSCRLAPYVLTSLAPTREEAVRNAKGQIGFYYTTDLYHSILEHHGLKHVGDACRAALKKFDTRAMAEAIPDALVDEIAIACTPDEAQDRLAQWKDLTGDPLLYPPSVGLRPEKQRENLDLIFATFGLGAA
ncbi:MAG: LLM class flavin-dependent oxidoreductase [Deltaproteobacteria bacterium]|nr:LLM class flavin-dependent oxidoreductase [Deltaproteobacteria bacterium]